MKLLSNAVLLLAPALPAAQVITVGPVGSGATHTDIQSAIDAASPGQTVLVSPGNYSEFVLGKEVDVLGPGSALAKVVASASDTSAVIVRDLAAGAQVVVSGFEAVGGSTLCGFSPFQPSLCTPFIGVEDCQGKVVLEDLVADSQAASGLTGPALAVNDADHVLVYGCRLVGMDFLATHGATVGLDAEGSEMWIIDSSVQGGSGIHDISANGGSHGMRLDTSTAYLARTEVLGGSGGSSPAWGTGFGSASAGLAAIRADSSTLKLAGGPGANIVGGDSACWSTAGCHDGPDGIVLLNGSVALMTSDMPLSGGAASCGSFCAGYAAGSPYSVDGTSAVHETAAIYPTIGSDVPSVAPGDLVTLDIAGEAGAIAALFWSPDLGPSLSIPGIDGAVVLDLGSAQSLGSLTLDASGAASQAVNVPPVASLVGATAHLQGIHLGGYVGVTNPWLVYIR